MFFTPLTSKPTLWLVSTTLLGRPKNNSLAERNNLYVIDQVGTCLLAAGLPPRYWSFALKSTCHLLNIEDVEGESTWFRLHGKPSRTTSAIRIAGLLQAFANKGQHSQVCAKSHDWSVCRARDVEGYVLERQDDGLAIGVVRWGGFDELVQDGATNPEKATSHRQGQAETAI